MNGDEEGFRLNVSVNVRRRDGNGGNAFRKCIARLMARHQGVDTAVILRSRCWPRSSAGAEACIGRDDEVQGHSDQHRKFLILHRDDETLTRGVSVHIGDGVSDDRLSDRQ